MLDKGGHFGKLMYLSTLNDFLQFKEFFMETPDAFGAILFLGQDNQNAIYKGESLVSLVIFTQNFE